jgi:hypothetical protein
MILIEILRKLFFIIFFQPETELVVAWLRWSLHPLLVYMVYRPCDFYESDSSPCALLTILLSSRYVFSLGLTEQKKN